MPDRTADLPPAPRSTTPSATTSSAVAGGRKPSLGDFWHDLPRDGKFLISTVAVETLGSGLVLPFGVVYLHEVRGFPLELTGSLLAIPAILAMLVVGPAGSFIDRFGARRAILAGMLAQLTGNVLLAFADTPARAAAGYALVGMAMGVFWPSFNAMIAAVVPSGIRQRYFGVNFTLVNLGIGVGGVIGGWYVDVGRPATFTTVYLANAASFVVPLTMLLWPLRHVTGRAAVPPAADGRAARTSYLALLRDRVLLTVLLLNFLAAFVGYAQMEAGFTAYARLVGEVSTQAIGLAFAANTATIVLLQLVVLQRIEGRRRTRVLLLMCLVWAVSWLSLGLSGLVPGTLGATVLVVSSMAVFGLGETLLQPTIPAITNDLAPDHLRGRYNAVMAGAFQAAAVSGPVVAGVMLGRALNGPFIGMLIGGCAAMALLVRRVVEPRIPLHANGVRAPQGQEATVSPPATTG